jgi:hypothetical protein
MYVHLLERERERERIPDQQQFHDFGMILCHPYEMKDQEVYSLVLCDVMHYNYTTK